MKSINKNALARTACDLERMSQSNGITAARDIAVTLRRLITRGSGYTVPQTELDVLIAECPDQSCSALLRQLI